MQLHEIGKYVGLVLKGNPTVTELLYLESHEFVDPQLPEALGQATKTKQNSTEFLEQLLRVEVDATEARRLKGRQRLRCTLAPNARRDEGRAPGGTRPSLTRYRLATV